jgi:Fe2+ or Zn2+ uptake regulation protein
MRHNKTQQAILDVLNEQPHPVYADYVFMQLNPLSKCHSYAAIYRNIRVLCEQGLVIAEKTGSARRKKIQIVR